jgi:hypothetical protein
MKATAKEIKDNFFTHNSIVSSSFIRDVMIDEFKFIRPTKNESYKSLNLDVYKTGQPFYIPKSEICVIKSDIENDEKIALLNEKNAKNTTKDDFLKTSQKTL